MVELRPPKIELFSAVFSQRATECNWATGNRKISPLLPVRPTHVTALLSLVFVLPSTATAILHRTPPPPPQPVLLLRASRSPPPSGSGHHPSPMPLPPCSRTACTCHHRQRLLWSLGIRRGTSFSCHPPRATAPPAAPTALESRLSSGVCRPMSTAGRTLSTVG
jgi:hypothetical protein